MGNGALFKKGRSAKKQKTNMGGFKVSLRHTNAETWVKGHRVREEGTCLRRSKNLGWRKTFFPMALADWKEE